MCVGDHQLHAVQTAPGHALQEGGPERLRLRWPEVKADDLPLALGVGGHGDYRRDRDDPAALALLEVGRIQPGPVPDERAVEEGADAVVESSNPANTAFYQRLGFEVLGFICAGDLPPMMPMLRPAR